MNPRRLIYFTIDFILPHHAYILKHHANVLKHHANVLKHHAKAWCYLICEIKVSFSQFHVTGNHVFSPV